MAEKHSRTSLRDYPGIEREPTIRTADLPGIARKTRRSAQRPRQPVLRDVSYDASPTRRLRCNGAEVVAPGVGFEPTTNRLTAGCSTAELSRISGLIGSEAPHNRKVAALEAPFSQTRTRGQPCAWLTVTKRPTHAAAAALPKRLNAASGPAHSRETRPAHDLEAKPGTATTCPQDAAPWQAGST